MYDTATCQQGPFEIYVRYKIYFKIVFLMINHVDEEKNYYL